MPDMDVVFYVVRRSSNQFASISKSTRKKNLLCVIQGCLFRLPFLKFFKG